MSEISSKIQYYFNEIKKGIIPEAYGYLLGFNKSLRQQLEQEYPEFIFSSNLYEGRMDFTYFHYTTKVLKSRKLKIVIIFHHDSFTFEVLLSGMNRKGQKEAWEYIRNGKWGNYKLTEAPGKEDFVLSFLVSDKPDFDKEAELKRLIIDRTITFTQDIEEYLKSI